MIPDYLDLRHCDNMELMAQYPDKHFDLAIVDPPYGIKASSGASTNGTMRQKIASGEIKGGAWDDCVPNKSYFKELFRVSKNQIVWGGNYFDMPPTKCFMIWDKGESMYGRDFAECEMAWASFDKCARIFKLFPNQLDRMHPTQKPIQLYKWLLKNSTKEGDKILDTHLGSMSIAIAVHEMNKQGMNLTLVGCELDEDYYNQAMKRVENACLQMSLI